MSTWQRLYVPVSAGTLLSYAQLPACAFGYMQGTVVLTCRQRSTMQPPTSRTAAQHQLTPAQSRSGRSWCPCCWQPLQSARSSRRSRQKARPLQLHTTWQQSPCCACRQGMRTGQLTSCQPCLQSALSRCAGVAFCLSWSATALGANNCAALPR